MEQRGNDVVGIVHLQKLTHTKLMFTKNKHLF
jgi:hypothetical protein